MKDLNQLPSKHKTSPQRRCNVTTFQRRCNDVVVTLCVYLVYSVATSPLILMQLKITAKNYKYIRPAKGPLPHNWNIVVKHT